MRKACIENIRHRNELSVFIMPACSTGGKAPSIVSGICPGSWTTVVQPRGKGITEDTEWSHAILSICNTIRIFPAIDQSEYKLVQYHSQALANDYERKRS